MNMKLANVNWYPALFALALGILMVSCSQSPRSDPKWIFQVHGQFHPEMTTVVADDEKYYIVMDVGSILALHRDDGALEWYADIVSENIANGDAPANLWVSDLWLAGDLLHVVYNHTMVSVIDTKSGHVVDHWRLPQNLERPVPPHLASQNTVVLGSRRGSVSAVSLPTGDLKWETAWIASDKKTWALPVSSGDKGVLCVGDPVVISSHNDIGLVRNTPIKYLSLDTGEEVWQTTGGILAEVLTEEFPGGGYLGDIQATEAFDKLYIMIGNTLSAVSQDSGSLVWQQLLPGRLEVLIALDSQNLVAVNSVTSSVVSLLILDSQSGQVISTYELGEGMSFLAFSDLEVGIVYILARRMDTQGKIPQIVTDVYKLDIENDNVILTRTVNDNVLHFDVELESILTTTVEGNETVFRLQ